MNLGNRKNKSKSTKRTNTNTVPLFTASGIIVFLEYFLILFSGNMTIRFSFSPFENIAFTYMFFLVWFAFNIVLSPLFLGFINMVKQNKQGETIHIKNLFTFFRSPRLVGKALYAYLTHFIYLCLWVIPFIILLITFNNAFTGKIDDNLFFSIRSSLIWLIQIVFLVKLITYALFPFVLVENIDKGTQDCLKMSKQLLSGLRHKIGLFLLLLCFVWCFYLSFLTFGLLLAILLPYFVTIVSYMYNSLKESKQLSN